MLFLKIDVIKFILRIEYCSMFCTLARIVKRSCRLISLQQKYDFPLT